MLYCKDKEFYTEELFEYFTANNCEGLVGKPKLFFIQVIVVCIALPILTLFVVVRPARERSSTLALWCTTRTTLLRALSASPTMRTSSSSTAHTQVNNRSNQSSNIAYLLIPQRTLFVAQHQGWLVVHPDTVQGVATTLGRVGSRVNAHSGHQECRLWLPIERAQPTGHGPEEAGALHHVHTHPIGFLRLISTMHQIS